ncbi:hypothetical protein V2G26_007520 [Clonostachys chloroleuca]
MSPNSVKWNCTSFQLASRQVQIPLSCFLTSPKETLLSHTPLDEIHASAKPVTQMVNRDLGDLAFTMNRYR